MKRANNSPYGLAAGIFSNNIHTVNTLTRGWCQSPHEGPPPPYSPPCLSHTPHISPPLPPSGLHSGTVWVNCYNINDPAVPFGGYKDSGIGREKGEYALSNYTKASAGPGSGSASGSVSRAPTCSYDAIPSCSICAMVPIAPYVPGASFTQVKAVYQTLENPAWR